MINLYTDISYSNLYNKLIPLLQVACDDVFAETWIVVPNHSAKQWLQKSLSKDLGVCAQIKFIMPLSFNWEVLKNVSENIVDVNVFSTDVLRWQIYNLIQSNNKYQHLKQNSDIENFNYAEKLSQTFLKYSDEYPERIQKWDTGVYEVPLEDEWQIELWLDLLDKLQIQSPVQLLQKFNPNKDFKQTPDKIIFFATEQLTTLQKDTLLKLSNSHDVYMFISNPCPQDYWFDLKPAANKARAALFNPKVDDVIEVGNPLLANLGFNKMALFDALLSHEVYLQDSNHVVEGNSLLQSLKQDVFDLTEHPSESMVDRSIAIHSCHTNKREVEIIKDEILNSLDSNTDLKPEDIIVVAPDINDYVQSIKEVFSYDGSANSQYIPFHVDRVQLSDAPYVTALMKLITSFTDEMSAPVIYELLTQNIILQKFKLQESDLPRLKNWMIDSNIRNYYSAQQKNQKGYENKIGNTWQFGKNRWLTGYLAGEQGDTQYLSTYGDVSGQEEMFSNCFEFLNLWFKYQEKSQSKHSPQQWYKFVQELCNDFLYNDFSDDYESRILKQLETKFIKQVLTSEPEIGFVIIKNIIQAVITDNTYRSEGQIGIRFQTWENAFITNAKLLIIMGLSDNEFPKKSIKNDLNLFSKIPARLNKSTRQRDKNLMLTALTENTEQLIMTYIGFNSKTNDEQPPSVILAEIISYVGQKTKGKFKVNVHKMHGYHQQYYANENNKSYNHKNHQLALSHYDSNPLQDNHEVSLGLANDTDIALNDLCGFFSDPLDYFLKKRAQINLPVYDNTLQDTETYTPTGLESWQLMQDIFVHGKTAASKTGILSDNKLGQSALNKISNDISSLVDQTKHLNFTPKEIEITINDSKVFGNIMIDELGHFVSIYPSKISGKRICFHWIQHLCYQANKPSYIIFENKCFKFNAIEQPQAILREVIACWAKSYDKPWLFCPKDLISFTKDFKVTREKYLKKFNEDNFVFPSEGQKYFYKYVQERDEEVEQVDIATFMNPMYESMEIDNEYL